MIEMMRKGKKFESGYATVDDGVNYRDIADTMTEIGYTMNHSSARNYVLRVMKKFAEAIVDQYGIKMSEEGLDRVAKSPMFQSGIAEVLQDIEYARKF
ncbi:MAG: hypothetical protein EBU90_07200 [Proteobacteria bacterium]|nr:hypothetical protein [Pseudomonadota bacterium]